MKGIFGHIKRHGKSVHQHIKKHHKKYIFGAVSGALGYKVLSIIAATIFANPLWVSFASESSVSWDIQTWAETATELTWTFVINEDQESTTGTSVILNNNITWADYMRFANDQSSLDSWSWEIFSQTKEWTLDSQTGTKIVYAQFSWVEDILNLQDDISYIPIEEEQEIEEEIEETEEIVEEVQDVEEVEFILDTSPNTFNFVDVANANLTSEYYSNTINIDGINTWTNISITNWLYKINDWSWLDIESLIYSWDSVQIKTFSNDDYGQSKTVTLSVWDLDVDWTITNKDTNQICDSTDLNILSPLSWDILSWDIDILWDYNNSDCDWETFTIKLRDANTQYITIWNTGSETTWINFDSSLLYSWFYNITWLNLSGEVETLYTWEYSGYNTTYFTWHKIVILNLQQEILHEWDYFTIDNEKPNIDSIEINTNNTNTWYAKLWDTIDVMFESSEELSWAQVNILWTYALLQSNSWNLYHYTMDLNSWNTQWIIIYNIEFEDLAWNTWYYEWVETWIIFDNAMPTLENIEFTNTWDIINILIETDENTISEFNYYLSWSNTGQDFNNTTYWTSYNYILSWINTWSIYNYSFSISDVAWNIWYIGWYFQTSWDNVDFTFESIESGNMIVNIWFSGDNSEIEENTWVLISTSIADTFRAEIEKFNICKAEIDDFNEIEIPVRKYNVILEMPELEKSYVKKVVSAFSIVLFDRMEEARLTNQEVDEITKEFNNFLVILKLVKDNDNECEQNLSNYYMSKFKKTLKKYEITVE